jgi:hypothetical protein
MKATNLVAHGPEVGLGETQSVPLSSLSEMTGFPVDFIKSELLVNEDQLSMEDLRKSMASYLESTLKETK